MSMQGIWKVKLLCVLKLLLVMFIILILMYHYHEQESTTSVHTSSEFCCKLIQMKKNIIALSFVIIMSVGCLAIVFFDTRYSKLYLIFAVTILAILIFVLTTLVIMCPELM